MPGLSWAWSASGRRFHRRLDALDVDLGHVETSGVRTVVTLAANVIALVVLFALAVLVLGMDGQNVIVDVDVDVFLAEARQVGFKL